MTSNDFSRRMGVVLLVPGLLLAGCASLTVHKVEPKDDLPGSRRAAIKGVRYFLPKPFLVVAPQADGTIAVSVMYLPDRSKQYAIETSSIWSSYSFQATTDASGILTGVQYGADTTALATQLASSAATGVAQTLNAGAAQSAAAQTQVNTAQGAVVTAQSSLAAAQAALASDTASNVALAGTVAPPAIQVDQSSVAQAQAKLLVAQSALAQAQGSAQAVAGTAAAAAPIAQTGAPASSGTFTPPGWQPTTPIGLPEKYGPVIYAISDTDDNVGLKVVSSGNALPSAESEADDELYGFKYSQQAFATSTLALLPGVLSGPAVAISKADNAPATFSYDRAAKVTAKLYKANNDKTSIADSFVKVDLDAKTISVKTSGLDLPLDQHVTGGDAV